MTNRPEYDALREECAQIILHALDHDQSAVCDDSPDEMAGAILAHVYRTLQTVTPDMREAIFCIRYADSDDVWLAGLAASPLNPGKT